jgi:hypothetical protein
MDEKSLMERLDRHALVMALWTPAAFIAAVLLFHGITGAGGWWTTAGFVVILAGFVGHVIVNAVLGTDFTAGETALALVAFGVAMISLLLSVLLTPSETGLMLLVLIGPGLVALVIAVISYMVIAYGPRAAFEKFDVARSNNRRRASHLPHRGGRR